jgi:Domain of unknown function (DUF6457)
MSDRLSESDEFTLLARWRDSLLAELGLDGAEIDIDAVLALAGVIAHAVVRPAAPLTAYIVGYAAGRAAAGDPAGDAEAFVSAASTARALAEAGDFAPDA